MFPCPCGLDIGCHVESSNVWLHLTRCHFPFPSTRLFNFCAKGSLIPRQRNQSQGVLPVLSFLRTQEAPFHDTAEGDPYMRKGDRIL